MNPIETVKDYISKGGNFQQLFENAMKKTIENNNPNPMFKNLIGMAEKGDTQGVETFARNLFKEQGRDFDKEYSQFKNTFNLK